MLIWSHVIGRFSQVALTANKRSFLHTTPSITRPQVTVKFGLGSGFGLGASVSQGVCHVQK